MRRFSRSSQFVKINGHTQTQRSHTEPDRQTEAVPSLVGRKVRGFRSWSGAERATSWSKLQQAATSCNKLPQAASSKLPQAATSCKLQAATSCNKLQAATTCHNLQAPSCNHLRQAATICNKLQPSATSCKLQAVTSCHKLQAPSCNHLRQAAGSCKLQAATSCNFFSPPRGARNPRGRGPWEEASKVAEPRALAARAWPYAGEVPHRQGQLVPARPGFDSRNFRAGNMFVPR